MEISIKQFGDFHRDLMLLEAFGWRFLLNIWRFYFPKLFSCEAFQKFPKVSAHFLYKIPYLKVLKKQKNHSSKGGSPASSFLTLFRGGL